MDNRSSSKILISLYLVIRLIVPNYLKLAEIQSNELITNSIQFIIYLIIIALLLINRDYFKENNISPLSILCICLSSTLLLSHSVGTLLNYVFIFLFWLSTAVLILKLKIPWKNYIKPIKSEILWIISSAFIFIIFNLCINASCLSKVDNILVIIPFILAFISSMSQSVILEEPIFRGFLFGYLTEKKVKPYLVIIITGFLFWISHIASYEKVTFFFIYLPVVSLFLGVITYKSKSILPAIICHGLWNASIYIFSRIC
jgi:membrane protease YdiL (CAAX protease family)